MNFTIKGAFSNFVMQTTKVMTKVKEIIVNSPKYGRKIILIDSEDYELVSKYKWLIHKSSKGSTFYAVGRIHWKDAIPMHRLILKTPKGKLTDHIDGNGLNNQRDNLRVCNKSQNMMNRGLQKNNTTGYKGVYIRSDTKKYAVEIKKENKKIRLGCYSDLLIAVQKYNEAALKYHGEFAKLNPLPCVQ